MKLLATTYPPIMHAHLSETFKYYDTTEAVFQGKIQWDNKPKLSTRSTVRQEFLQLLNPHLINLTLQIK